MMGRWMKCFLVLCTQHLTYISPAMPMPGIPGYDPLTPTSTQQQAIVFVDSISELSPSIYWPGIKPALFLQNVKTNVHEPLSIYPGRGTNFCGYGALTYLFLQDDPLGYARLLFQLYREGKASYRNTFFNPSLEVESAAGTLRSKGILDIHPAEQMWFLCLADHFKGYLNFFHRTYHPGDEDSFWAAVNYAKFNRMVRQLLHYKVNARGSDLFRPSVGNTVDYITKKMKEGIVVLYVNNRILHKKKLEKIKLQIPTHYVILESIANVNDTVTLIYWDYGSKTLRQIKSGFLNKIIFGISCCTKKETHEE